MRVLLPPSETKRSDGGSVAFNPSSLAHHSELHSTRQAVINALVALSGDEDTAMRSLKLGVKSRSELQHNLSFDTATGLTAALRYTGVLYDALDAATMSPTELEWLGRNVRIQSALFGLVRATDEIAPYRLSATSKLPVLGRTLKALWNEAHTTLWSSDELIIDLRSKDYAALAPIPSEVPHLVIDVVSEREDGVLRALNHFNKRAKGLFVRDLAQTLSANESVIRTAKDLHAWGLEHGTDLRITADPRLMQLVTTEGAPITVA